MSEGFPSMTALLGLLALTGYQNSDKLAEMLDGVGQGRPAPSGQGRGQGCFGDLLGSLGGDLGSAGRGSFLNSGLGEMLQRFHQNGHGGAVQSWASPSTRSMQPRLLHG